jgi:lauroyl/myristoyl acyltransferase
MRLSTENTGSITDSIHEGSRLQFFPFLIRRIKKDDYNVIRIGGRKITFIATHEIGREALCLLRKGLSLGQTKRILGARRRRPPEQIDLKPLIDALAGARMIRCIDEKSIESEQPSKLRIVYHYLQCGVLAAREATITAVIRYLPVALAHRILFYFQLSQQRRKSQSLQAKVRENLRLAFGPAAPRVWIDAVATEFEHEVIRRMIDSRCLHEMSIEKSVRWFKNSVEISGREYLDAARAKGRGVILCGFHFSSPGSLSFLLWLHNYSLTGVGLMGRIADEERLHSYYDRVKRQTPQCADLKWFNTLDLKSFSELRKSLANGETVLLFADAFVPALQSRNKGEARYFGNTIAEYLPARTHVKLLGQTIAANKGAAWLHLQTGAPVIPIKMLRKGCRHYKVILEPQLNFEGAASIDAVTAVIYRALEQDIHVCPGQWAYWGAFHKMMVPTNGINEVTKVHKFRQSDWPDREEAIAQADPARQNPKKKRR